MTTRMKKPIWIMIVLFFGLSVAQIRADDLEKGFAQPPDSAKPHTWWHWMNGNISKEGITADLEAMARVGLGGAQIFNAGAGIPAGPVGFLTPEWRELMKHTAKEATRLGLELCLHNCPGWSSSGGPWNQPENAMQQITISETRVKGPVHYSGALRQPATKLGFYRDIAVLAFPTLAGEDTTMHELLPKVTASTPDISAEPMFDGNDDSFVTLPMPEDGLPPFIQVEFPQVFAARSVVIKLHSTSGYPKGVVQTSADGVEFRDVQPFSFPFRGTDPVSLSLGGNNAPVRFYRIKFTNIGVDYNKLPAKFVGIAELSLSSCLRTGDYVAKTGMNKGQLTETESVDASVASGLAVNHHEIVNLTDGLKTGGQFAWDVPAGSWTILRIGYTLTGAKNHPAPDGADGLECDKLNAEALDAHWAGFVQKVVDDLGPLAGKGKAFNNVLIDSYEVGGQNWTPKFREEFQRLRGYDPLPWLVTVTGRVVDSPEVTERFLWDMRRTVADLFAEKYYGHFKELCNARGLTASIQPYGRAPFEALQCGAAAEIPMGEFWIVGGGFSTLKLAASVGHIYGRPIIGSEAFTAQPGKDSGRWLNDPYSMKAIGDQVFCHGINRLLLHTCAMQPWPNRQPGMTLLKYGTHFGRATTWWEQSSAWIKYITRSQFLLQQGHFVADAAAFCGENVPTGEMSNPGLPPSYDYDGINADVLLSQAAVVDGRLVLKSGMRYRILILPNPGRTMTPKLLRKLRELVADGLTLVGPPPQRSPSLDDYPKCDAEVKSLVAEMWGDCNGSSITEHQLGKGKVVWGRSMEQVLTALNAKPDFQFAASGGAQLNFIHRLADDADIYFVCNQRAQADFVECTFRVSGKVPEIWHPDTGHIEWAPVWREEGGHTIVPLSFDPAGSVFVVFRKPSGSRDHLVSATFSSTPNPAALELISDGSGQVRLCAAAPGVVEGQTAAGRKLRAEVRDVLAPIELTGPWELTFPPNWGAPGHVTMPTLVSWSEYGDSGVKYFSGTAKYVKEVEIPATMSRAGCSLWLDLGRVKNLANVSLNGKPLGILWKPPYRVDITGAARPGNNKLEIEVANLWPNRLIGDEQLPPDCEWNGDMLRGWPQWLLDGKPSPTGRFAFTTWRHWKKDDALLESGLLGPVRLSCSEAETLK